MSVRDTTAPGVIAMSLPMVKASGSTIFGMCGAEAMSPANARTPRTTLRPPVSMKAFHASGLMNGLLLGADAAMRFIRMNVIFVLSFQSRSASSSSPSAVLPRAR